MAFEVSFYDLLRFILAAIVKRIKKSFLRLEYWYHLILIKELCWKKGLVWFRGGFQETVTGKIVGLV